MRPILLVAAALLATSASSAGAQTVDVPRVSQPGPAMKDGESYYITYSCKVTADLPAYVRRQSRNLFRSFSGATEVFAITGGDSKVDATVFDPGSAINPKIVFSAASSRGSYATNDPSTCNGSLIASGSDQPKLAYFLKFTRQTVPSGLATVLTTIQSMIAPIYKIVRDKELHDKDKDHFEQITNITKIYNDYLALFTEPESTSRAVALKVGRNTLTTGAATVVVDVKKVENGFLLDDEIPFTNRYPKLVTVATQFKAENLPISCGLMVSSLASAGFTTPDDQAYIMYRSLGADVIKSKKDFMNCLGLANLAPTVVNNRRLYLKHFPDALVLNQADLDEESKNIKIGQVDEEILSLIYRLTQIAGSGKDGLLVSGSETELAKISTPSIEVNDWSAEHVVSPSSATAAQIALKTTGTAAEQIGKLVAAKYSKYGCYSLTRSDPSLGGKLDGATAVILASRPATNTEAAKTVALRLFFDGKTLKRFDVTDTWIDEARASYERPGSGRRCPI
ncbi:hypothetical protein E0H68_03730 [Rhizobium leguminosarum bv. viciae]|uniref:hypothetical protein n=1 Tax=Rhizobium leguminosarum TaxID=384 RepID=UPI00103F5F3B|nr:hypothetical protein [Rhizobium leguminosarum]TCA18555.1 hypothetical protein E0H68_03730 [Rhizobium leguminosarum bv. viciae]